VSRFGRAQLRLPGSPGAPHPDPRQLQAQERLESEALMAEAVAERERAGHEAEASDRK
jgi:hypothetical protein